jgi:2-oxoglutarate ferredoxin oxidoreductase subunit alpha
MRRLLRKFETAKELVPQPVIRRAKQKTKVGAIYYGSTSPAMDEAMDVLDEQGVMLDAIRVRAFPFSESVVDFVAEHDQVFVIEQNRDAQLRLLLINELNVDPAKMMPVLHYDGTPITARFILGEISERMRSLNVQPLKKGKAA